MSDWSYNALWQLKKQMLGIFSKGTEQNQDIFILLYKSALTYLMIGCYYTSIAEKVQLSYHPCWHANGRLLIPTQLIFL